MKTLAVITFLIASYACSSFEKEEAFADTAIYQGYRFEYDEEVNETNISAVFRTGSEDGEEIKLSPPAFLTVNDEFCNYQDNNPDYPYNITFKSRLPEAVLEFVDFDKNIFTNSIKLDSLVQVKDFKAVVDSDSRKVEVMYEGKDMCKGESLKLIVSAGEDEIVYDVTEGDDNVITISDDIIEDFKGKLVSLKLLRIKNIDLADVSPAGGSVQLVYSSKIKEVQL